LNFGLCFERLGLFNKKSGLLVGFLAISLSYFSDFTKLKTNQE
jgi:hypothetical protein